MEFCQLGLKLSGCNKEVAALHSDHYTQVWLYCPSDLHCMFAIQGVHEYSQVYGRIIGYQVRQPQAFILSGARDRYWWSLCQWSESDLWKLMTTYTCIWRFFCKILYDTSFCTHWLSLLELLNSCIMLACLSVIPLNKKMLHSHFDTNWCMVLSSGPLDMNVLLELWPVT